MVAAEIWDGMRDDGHLAVDHTALKVGVFANESGFVVIALKDGNYECFTAVEPDAIDAIVEALQHAKRTAVPIVRRRDAEYDAYVAIEIARGKN